MENKDAIKDTKGKSIATKKTMVAGGANLLRDFIDFGSYAVSGLYPVSEKPGCR